MPTPRKPKRWRSSSSRSPAARRRRSVRWKPWGSTRARGRSWRARARRSRARWSARRRRCGPIPGRRGRALQPLRGLAALTDLPPLPDLLEGIERALGELSRSGLEPPTNLGELFQVAGSAIARAAREVAERGRPDPEGPDFRQFAGLLVKFMESEPDAVSIGSLYYSDSGPHIVSRGVPAARPSTLGKLELVSHGEHLRQAADSLERAPSATQRELRAHTLGTTFRALANAGGGVLADRVAQFAIAGREAVASGIAVSSAAAFAAVLRRAGDLLARSGTGDEEALATELDALTAAL